MKKKHVSILCAGVLSVMTFSCKEDIGSVGLALQPQDELLNTDFFDTTTLMAYSAKNDSVITSSATMNLLGDIGDPVFGRTKASIYTQFQLSKEGVDFKEGAQIDSLVLRLVYGGYYGDTLKSLRIRVYELDEDLDKSTIYYGFSSAAHKSNPLADVRIYPAPNTPADTLSNAAYISIPLDKNFGDEKFLSKSGEPELDKNANFVKYFKGLYIEAEAESPNGCMLSINLLHSKSSLSLYYGNNELQGQTYPFTLDTSCVRFSNINHFDYAGAASDLLNQLNGNNSSVEEVLYAQSSGGIKTVIHFPNLKAMFADQQVVIHKAELVVTRKDDALSDYIAPANLSLNYYNPLNGKNMVLPDNNLMFPSSGFATDYLGGSYDKTTQQYRFCITKYVQFLINGTISDDCRLNLMVSSAAIKLSRSMFYGTNPSLDADTDKRIKLRINYTIVKNK